jgi:hypothetical protein
MYEVRYNEAKKAEKNLGLQIIVHEPDGPLKPYWS